MNSGKFPIFDQKTIQCLFNGAGLLFLYWNVFIFLHGLLKVDHDSYFLKFSEAFRVASDRQSVRLSSVRLALRQLNVVAKATS